MSDLPRHLGSQEISKTIVVQLLPECWSFADKLSEPVYFFSIPRSVLLEKPWCEGITYILARQLSVQEVPQQVQGVEIILPHWIRSIPAKPVVRLRIGSQDFLFHTQLHGHDDEKLVRPASSDPGGFPRSDTLVRWLCRSLSLERVRDE